MKTTENVEVVEEVFEVFLDVLVDVVEGVMHCDYHDLQDSSGLQADKVLYIDENVEDIDNLVDDVEDVVDALYVDDTNVTSTLRRNKS